MPDWITTFLASPRTGVSLMGVSFVLGLISAVTSGCNLAVLAAVAGYAGSVERGGRKKAFWVSVYFTLGVIIVLAVLGSIMALVGQAAAAMVGQYGKILSGLFLVLMGLLALNLVPIGGAWLDSLKKKTTGSRSGAMMFGLVLGISTVACTMFCCAPILPLAMGLAAFQNGYFWSIMVMVLFALGFSLPLAALMTGLNFGKSMIKVSGINTVIRYTAGLLLILAGFYVMLK